MSWKLVRTQIQFKFCNLIHLPCNSVLTKVRYKQAACSLCGEIPPGNKFTQLILLDPWWNEGTDYSYNKATK